MKTHTKIGVKGEYKLTVRKADGSVKSETGWCPNLLTNSFFSYMLSGQSSNTGARRISAVAGAGSATPSESDTRLQSYLGGCSSLQAFDNQSAAELVTPPYFIEQMWVLRSAQGGVVGNVTEVGIINATSPSGAKDVLSRALVVDSNGNPTSVTVLGDEYLDVTWRLRYYASPSTSRFNMVIDGVTVPINASIVPVGMSNPTSNYGWNRSGSGTGGSDPANLHTVFNASSTGTAYTMALNRTTVIGPGDNPNFPGAVLIDTAYTKAAYTLGQKFRDFTYTLPLGSANVAGGINFLVMDFEAFKFHAFLDVAIPKTNTKVMRTTQRISLENYVAP